MKCAALAVEVAGFHSSWIFSNSPVVFAVSVSSVLVTLIQPGSGGWCRNRPFRTLLHHWLWVPVVEQHG